MTAPVPDIMDGLSPDTVDALPKNFHHMYNINTA
jgi:hypothetical protein